MPDWKTIDAEMTWWRNKIYRLLRDELKIGAEKGCFDCDYFADCQWECVRSHLRGSQG